MENASFDPMDLHDLVGQSGMTLGEMITSFRLKIYYLLIIFLLCKNNFYNLL